MIAVSVFDNETGLPEYDRLVAGMSDIVVTRLTMSGAGSHRRCRERRNPAQAPQHPQPQGDR